MDKINISLSLNEWNVVMNALCNRPFNEVNEIVYSIKTQADEQLVKNKSETNTAE